MHIKCGIYSIINKINGLIYIGSTNHLYHRKNQHFSLLNLNKHFNKKLQNSWNKYGHDQFEFSIIEECNLADLKIKEQFWINFYQSYKSQNGFNLVKIAERFVLSDETKNKISKNNSRYWKNKNFSIEHRNNMKKNSNKFWKNKKLSAVHRKNLSNSHKKNIVQLDENGNLINEFLGIKEAAEKTGFSEIGIQQVLTGYKRKKIYGFIFKYKS